MAFIGYADVGAEGIWLYCCPKCKEVRFPEHEFDAGLLDLNGDALICDYCKAVIK